MKLKTVPYEPGNCYTTCVELLLRNFLKIPSLRLVHGYPVLSKGPNKGKRFGHSWLELMVKQEPRCVDPSNQSMPVHKSIYYILGQIEESKCQIYDLSQVIEMLDEHQHCGPWVDLEPTALFKKTRRKL